MVGDRSYAIVALPRDTLGDTHAKTLVARARDFRLKSLQLAPESFGSTYELEIQREPEFWTNRVANPKATTLIAYRHDNTDTNDHVKGYLSAEWLGSITLLGPKYGLADFSLHTSPWKALDQETGNPKNAGHDPETLRHYLINGMFALPAARGSGLGKALVKAALDLAVKQTLESKAEIMKCTLVVDKDNDSARNLYLKSGFEIVKEEMFMPETGKHRPALTMDLMRTVEDNN